MCEINAFSFSALGNDLVLEPSTALPDQFLDVDIRDTQKVYLPHSSASKLFARPAPAPNLSRVLPGSCHSRTIHMPHYNRAPTSVAVANPCRASDIKRWDAGSRTYSGWDGLHHASHSCSVVLTILTKVVGRRTLVPRRRLSRSSLWQRTISSKPFLQSLPRTLGSCWFRTAI